MPLLRKNHLLLCIVALLFTAGYGHQVLGKYLPHHPAAEHAAHGHDDDDDGPTHDAPSHHDLIPLTANQFAKAVEQNAPAPVWVVLCNTLVVQLTAMLRDSREPRLQAGRVHSPPDERASGWLLVCRSALPVRGPSPV